MLAPGRKAFVRYFSRIDSTVKGLRLETFEQGALTKVTLAKEAKFLGKSGEWELRDITEHTFDGTREQLSIHPEKVMRMKLNLGPDDFYTIRNYKQTITTPQLVRFINKENARGTGSLNEYIIELHRRTADSATIFILTLIGVSVASRKVRGGIGLNLALGVALGAVFMVMSRFSVTFASSNIIPPLLGVWIPNLMFIAISLYLISKAQK